MVMSAAGFLAMLLLVHANSIFFLNLDRYQGRHVWSRIEYFLLGRSLLLLYL